MQVTIRSMAAGEGPLPITWLPAFRQLLRNTCLVFSIFRIATCMCVQETERETLRMSDKS